MLSTLLFLAAIVCAVAALSWYFAGAMKIASSFNPEAAHNDPLLKECRAELDDHTYLLGHATTKKMGAS